MSKPMLAFIVLAASAAPASAAGTTQFANLCEAKVPVATCGCMINELLRSRDGQITLDALQVMGRPEAERRANALAMLNKYGLKASDLNAVVDRAKPMFDAAYERCK